MAKVRIGHFVEAQIVQAIGADYIDESEVLTAADEDVRTYISRPPLVYALRKKLSCYRFALCSITLSNTIFVYHSSAVRRILARLCAEYPRAQP